MATMTAIIASAAPPAMNWRAARGAQLGLASTETESARRATNR